MGSELGYYLANVVLNRANVCRVQLLEITRSLQDYNHNFSIHPALGQAKALQIGQFSI